MLGEELSFEFDEKTIKILPFQLQICVRSDFLLISQPKQYITTG